MSTPETPKRGRGLDITLLLLMLGLIATCLWGAGVFDSEIKRDVRVSNVYVEDGVEIDEQQAEKDVGNRQLVLIYLDGELGERGSEICDEVESVAAGSVVVILDDQLERYGCALIPGYDDENFGKAYVAESQIGLGVASLRDQPQESAKAMASNFDTLVAADIASQEARSIDPPFARFIIAGIALAMVVLGALLTFLRGRRVAGLQADAIERRSAARGRLAERDAALASSGTRILTLDERYRELSRIDNKRLSSRKKRYVRLYVAALQQYTELNAAATDHSPDDDELQEQLDSIRDLATKLDAVEEIDRELTNR